MGKFKTNKGITLVALIVTIIVLLILATVSIKILIDQGIIGRAKSATEQYTEAQQDEQEKLLKAEYEMAKYEEKFEGSYSEYVLDKKYPGLKIGDYVNYDELPNGTQRHTPDITKGAGTSLVSEGDDTPVVLGTKELKPEDLKWRVLGVNNKGELELISADPTKQSLFLANDTGYANAEENLNNFCNDLYGKGTNAVGARSLNVDDINKLTHYDPKTYSGYGVEWQYRYPTEEAAGTREIQYSNNGGKTWYNTGYQTFRLPNEKTAISSTNPGVRKLQATYYYYNIAENLTTEDDFTSEQATKISNMIVKGTGTSGSYQWLASTSVSCNNGLAYFYVRLIASDGRVSYFYMFDTLETYRLRDDSVRPVVSLKSDIQIDNSDITKDGTTPEKAWQLK